MADAQPEEEAIAVSAVNHSLNAARGRPQRFLSVPLHEPIGGAVDNRVRDGCHHALLSCR
jgi:hypothetical protein